MKFFFGVVVIGLFLVFKLARGSNSFSGEVTSRATAYEDLPDFMKDKVDKNDLVAMARSLILKEFHHFEILVYLRGHPNRNILNFAYILHGMFNVGRVDLVEDLKGLWEYYLAMQGKAAKDVALAGFLEIVSSSIFNTVFEILFEPCRVLGLLDFDTKVAVRDLLLYHGHRTISLSFHQLAYLYDIDMISLKEMVRNYPILSEKWSEVNERAHMTIGYFENILFNN